MTAKKFIHHLYQNVWKYIIQEKEFSKYWEVEEYPDYNPADFTSDVIPEFIKCLKEDFPFYSTYIEIVGSINLDERQRIVDFMIWFRHFENISSYEIYNKMMSNEGIELSPLSALAKFVESSTLADISTIEKRLFNKIDLLYTVIEKFTSASKSLSERRKGKSIIKIEDEYDMQDILHTMLKPHFPTIKIEEVVPGSDSGKFLKIDFILSDIEVAIECKCIRNKSHASKITKEINDDIQTYHKHGHCSRLIFFIYDKELLIYNPDILEENYSKKQVFDGKDMFIDLRIRPKN